MDRKWPHPEPQFMEDKAPGHRAKSTKDWHQACRIKFAGWPENSPDLNSIKIFWSQIKHLQRKEQETSNKGIKKVARKVWRAITPEYFNSLYESVPRRMAAVIAAGGSHTKYSKY